MLINARPYLRPGIVEVAYFSLTNHSIPSRWTIKLPHLHACIDSQGMMGVKWMCSRPKQREQGSRNRKMSSQILQTSESNLMTEESLQDPQLSPAYETAMEALSSLITQRKRGVRPAVASKYVKLDRMLMYVKILGLEEHLPGLKIIHVAGTKGKGSTCALCEAILQECGFRTGLFTSPHLIDVRERFRLDGVDISEDKFLHYFWDCWNQLEENVTEDLPMPPLFQFLTVLAFKIFVSEKVDVAIIEVGIGGRNDSTNVIKEPIVCGITSLGMDHMEVLGDTLGQIASHKAGIFKCRVPAFTVAQQHEAMDVIRKRADELMVPLDVVAPLDCKKYGIKLSLSGDHQFINAGLAVSLCKSWLKSTGNWESLVHQNNQGSDLPEAFVRGLSTARLSGRAQVLHYSYLRSSTPSKVDESRSGDLAFYLDGAHSPESMGACARWFSTAMKENIDDSFSASALMMVGTAEESKGNGYIQNQKMESNRISKTILLFNCMDVRDPEVLLQQLVETCASSGTYFSKAIFVPNMSTYSKITSGASPIPLVMPYKDLSWQFNLQRIWEKIIHGTDILEESLERGTSAVNLPTLEFLYEDVSHCSPEDGILSCSAVFYSLPVAIDWLKKCLELEDNPSIRIQVLVTGSLHLVGDVLKLLRRRP